MVTTVEALPCDQQDCVAIDTAAPSLLDLNDDCLELILRKLNLLQQFQVSQLNTRLTYIVQSHWRTRLRHVAIYPELLLNISNAEFVDFFTAIAAHMERLFMRQLGVPKLRLLSDCVFPKTIAFDWVPPLERTNSDDVDEIVPPAACFLDEDVLMLQRVFPNLRTLKLRSCQITGKYLADFPALQQLSLDECQCLESEQFREIFQRLKLRKFDIMEDCDELNCCDLVELKRCPTLEHIKIADYHLCFDTDIIHDILRMPRLRKLSICSKNFVFDVMERIARNLIKPIEAFKFNGVLHSFERFFAELSHMQCLQKLAFHDCRGYDIEGIRNRMLQQVAAQLPMLREIHFCGCELESEAGLLHFVRYCRQLRLVNITNTHKIKETFVWRCIELLRKQQWRSEPLELWIKHTDIACSILEDPRLVHSKRLLKIDTKKWTVDANPPGVLKFTFAT